MENERGLQKSIKNNFLLKSDGSEDSIGKVKRTFKPHPSHFFSDSSLQIGNFSEFGLLDNKLLNGVTVSYSENSLLSSREGTPRTNNKIEEKASFTTSVEPVLLPQKENKTLNCTLLKSTDYKGDSSHFHSSKGNLNLELGGMTAIEKLDAIVVEQSTVLPDKNCDTDKSIKRDSEQKLRNLLEKILELLDIIR